MDLVGILTGASAVFAVGASFYSVRQARRTATDSSRIELKKVDALAFERARASYEAAIAQLERQIERMKITLDEIRDEKYMLQKRLLAVESEATILRQQLTVTGLINPHHTEGS